MPIHHALFRALLCAAATCVGGCAAVGGVGSLPFEEGIINERDAPTIPRGVDLEWSGPVEDDEVTAWTEPGELPRLRAHDGGSLPLRLTDVHADVRGHVADVVVVQRFVNDRETPIEVVYTFPLPENAAVTDMKMVIGDRVIDSEVKKRDEARTAYVEAAAAGKTAALLEQERPNVFTQSVANIPGGATIDVEIHYLQTLSFDAGTFELVFPMVVGPRYPTPGSDASRVSPSVVGHGTRAGDDIAIAVDVDAGGPIAEITVPTHEVDVRRDDARVHVELAKADELPNRDFVLRWRPAPGEVRSTVVVGPPGPDGTGHFELLVVPPSIDVDARIGRREFVFVLDVSGSMSGEPLALEKTLLRDALLDLRPVDTFDVVAFASDASRLFDHPRPANAASIAEALQFVDGLEAGGGTEMSLGVQEALRSPVAEGRHRYVVFMTDGYISGEGELFAEAQALVKRQADAHRVARVFAIGVGSSPNAYLIEGLAKAGSGMAIAVSGREDPERALAKIQHVVDSAILTDVRVDWKGARVSWMAPRRMPDLFASHLLVVHGRYRGKPPAEGIELLARSGREKVVLPVRVIASPEGDRVMGRLWARAMIDELEERLWRGDDEDARRGIERLGLAYHLVTQFTSFVAIDHASHVQGPVTRIEQPTHAPEGVDVAMAGGVSYGSVAPTGGSYHRAIRVRAPPVAHGTSVGRVVHMEEFRNIPVGDSVSRDYTAVVESSPTAIVDSAGISIAGTTGAESHYTVEGATLNNPRFGTVGAPIVQDFLEEVDIQESGYDAEYGDAMGGQISARRVSGTNRLRGVARFTYTPRLAKPRVITGTDDALRTIDVPDYAMQGVVLASGPIIRDRLFWTGGAVVTGARSTLVQSFHHLADDGGTEKFAEQSFRTGNVALQFVFGVDWAITPRHRLTLTVLGSPGFDRRSYRRPAGPRLEPSAFGSNPAVAPLGGGSRVANGIVNGRFGWDRTNSTLVTLGYQGRLANDRLEIDARFDYAQFANVEAWRVDDPAARDQVASQHLGGDGFGLFELLDREGALDLVPGVAQACNDAQQPGQGCPVRQWVSGGLGQTSTSKQRRVRGSFALTHFFHGAGAHQLKYGADVGHLEDVTHARYSGSNAADFYDTGRIGAGQCTSGSGEYCWTGEDYVVDNATRVDNHRYVFIDDSDTRLTAGYGAIRKEAGELHPVTSADGAAVRGDAYRARVSTQNYAFFLQDKWAIMSNLFLNAGVRWEMQDIRDALGRRAVLIWDNVAPRIGLSYDWTDEGRSRLFASYGWFYQPLPLQLNARTFGGLVNVQRTYRESDCEGQRVDVDGTSHAKFEGGQPTEWCADVDAGTGRLGGGAVVPRLKGQYNRQFEFGYEHEVIDDLVLGVRWLHTDLGRAVEDVSPNGGVDFVLANPGVGVSGDDMRAQSQRCGDLQAQLDGTDMDDPPRSSLARELAHCESLADAFAKVGTMYAKPRRNYDAFTFELHKRFARNFMVLASYTYSRLVGNYEGFVDPITGSIDLGGSTQYDTPELVRNSHGPLSYDTPHRVKVDGFYAFDLNEAGRLTLGTSLRFASGHPISVRAGHLRYPGLFPVHLLPRGVGGRVMPNYGWNLGLAYAYPLPGDLELQVGIRWLNVTNAKATLRVDEVYTTDATRPVAGGELSDLKHTKVRDAGDPGAFFQRTLVTPQGNYGVAARFQTPTAAQFELQLRF